MAAYTNSLSKHGTSKSRRSLTKATTTELTQTQACVFMNAPRNQHCELCKKPAMVGCPECKLTFYCTVAHLEKDFNTIHNKLCQYFKILRAVTSEYHSKEERLQQAEKHLCIKKELLQMTRSTGQQYLWEEKYEDAIPAVLQSLKFAMDIYGAGSIELVPSFVMLAEACMGFDKFSEARAYLAQAQWTVANLSNCSLLVMAKLNRQLGRLSELQGNLAEAKRYYSEQIYNCTMALSGDDVHTSVGYFHLANINIKLNQLGIADSLYSRVIKIWRDYLQHIWEEMKLAATRPKKLLETTKAITLGEEWETEALRILQSIHAWYEKHSEEYPTHCTQSAEVLDLHYNIMHCQVCPVSPVRTLKPETQDTPTLSSQDTLISSPDKIPLDDAYASD